jgi:hypothetical protein
MTTAANLKSLAIRYVEAAGTQDEATLASILAEDVSFKGPQMATHSAEAFVDALRRMSPIWERNVVRAAFSDGDQVGIYYDFVTNTDAGSLPCFELLTFSGDRIKSIELLFDRAQFAPVAEMLAKRTAR